MYIETRFYFEMALLYFFFFDFAVRIDVVSRQNATAISKHRIMVAALVLELHS